MILGANVDRWLWWDWVGRNTDLIWSSLREHVLLTVFAVGIGLAIALPLGVMAARWRWMYTPTLGDRAPLPHPLARCVRAAHPRRGADPDHCPHPVDELHAAHPLPQRGGGA